MHPDNPIRNTTEITTHLFITSSSSLQIEKFILEERLLYTLLAVMFTLLFQDLWYLRC
jgi:hypothetical protein